MNRADRVGAVLRRGVSSRVFPGCSAEAGTAESAAWRETCGSLTYEPDSIQVSANTIFDLASLTKPVVTTTLAMRMVETGMLSPSDAIGDYEPAWNDDGRPPATIRDLLEHASGLPAWAPLWQSASGRDGIVAAAVRTPLDYVPRSQCVYSDLGFIVLGSIIERAGHAGLDQLFEGPAAAITRGSGTESVLTFAPPVNSRARIAPTRFSELRDRLLVGEVDDDNAWAMGGVAGHSGLFGTAAAVGAFARTLLRALQGETEAERTLASRETLRRFLSPSRVPGSSRAMGWDLMRVTSSCGSRMSPSAFGHTGFTGTSLWLDPDSDFYAVLLTNRVHPEAGPGEPIREIRRAFHDALLDRKGTQTRR